jgi:hypothetical protein
MEKYSNKVTLGIFVLKLVILPLVTEEGDTTRSFKHKSRAIAKTRSRRFFISGNFGFVVKLSMVIMISNDIS